MINLKNLKSLFIEETGGDPKTQKQPVPPNEKETTSKKSEENTPAAENTTEAPPSNDTPTPPPPPEKPVEVNPRIHAMLLNAIESNNLDGFDYLEFKHSLQSLSNLPMDEATKYQSAFKIASTMGLTLEKLLQSAEHYKGVLNNEKEKFRAQLEKRVNESIYSRDKERQQLETSIQQKQARIKALQEEISQHKEALGNVEGQVEEAVEKVETTKNSFILTFSNLMEQLEGDIQKISQYLVS